MNYFAQTCSCVFIILISRIEGFNVKLKDSTQIKHADIKGTRKSQLSYFGFDFALNGNVENNTATIVIGSPKYAPKSTPRNKSQPKPGNLFSCQFSVIDDEIKCSSINPTDNEKQSQLIYDNDSLGLSVIKGTSPNPSTADHLLTCAPLRQMNCTMNYLTQGTCYSSDDFGNTWGDHTKQSTSFCPSEYIDLMFVLDGSGSVTDESFLKVKSWVKNVTNKFDLNGPARVGVVQYSHWYRRRTTQQYIKTEIGIGEYRSHQMFDMAVDQINVQGFTTYTAHAINKTIEDFHSSDRFNRSDTKKVMILLTDGRSSDRRLLPESADYVRSQGITTFAVGVGDYSMDELRTIAGTEDRIYPLADFSQLNDIVDGLQLDIQGILEAGSNTNQTNELQNAQTGLSGFIGRVKYT